MNSHPDPIMAQCDWCAVCAEWERLASTIYTKAPDSPEATRLGILSGLIRDRLRVLCLPVDKAAMDALATMRDTLSRLPGGRNNINIDPEVSTPMAHAYVAVRAVWEREAGSSRDAATARKADAIDDADEYWPASAFEKGAGSKLRMAASPKRKTKHVRKKLIDGVVCYSVADVRRWYPAAIPTQTT